MSTRTLLIGIDEAGYGPLLGPLVISAVAFETPSEIADLSLWTTLGASVSPSLDAGRGRIPILDSKKLHRPKDGLLRLERSALPVLTAWRGLPSHLRGLLSLVAPDVINLLRDYAWYADHDLALPHEADSGAVRIAAKLLQADLAANSIEIGGLWSEVLLEGHYNRLVRTTQNKSVVLLGLTLRLMQRIADAFPDRELRFFIDKQGAREHYGPMLLRSFDDRRLKILEERPDYSAYELTGAETHWQIHFTQSGESCHLPTALASIISKYLRELFMACFNDYWRRKDEFLKPTAGYYADGLRFIRDIEPHLATLGVQRHTLVREK